MEGSPSANLRVFTSSAEKAPERVVIDRLYIKGGEYLIAGINMRVNAKRKPVSLHKVSAISKLGESLGDSALRHVDGRAWLVDGASALLHIVRVSLHRDAKNPVYEWKFDEGKFRDRWDGRSGQVSALKTLVDRENFNSPVCVEDLPTGKVETFGERAKRMLQAFEILVDAQVHVRAEDGIRVHCPSRQGQGTEGFDIMDVVEPHRPFETHIQYFKSAGNGWLNILPAIKATVIFGRGFGDLIVPRELSHVCDS